MVTYGGSEGTKCVAFVPGLGRRGTRGKAHGKCDALVKRGLGGIKRRR